MGSKIEKLNKFVSKVHSIQTLSIPAMSWNDDSFEWNPFR